MSEVAAPVLPGAQFPFLEDPRQAQPSGPEDMKRGAITIFSAGDYSKIALRLEAASKRLVADCGLHPGDRVLDVAAGNGNVAVAAARRGAEVVALDLTAAMVKMGRQRTSKAALDVEWVRADAERLPFADGQFDCVASVFGASMAPSPAVVAEELFRVVRPGGKVAMANWTSEGMPSRLGAIMTTYIGSPPMRKHKRRPPTYGWGHEAGVRKLFGDRAESVSFRRSVLRSKFKCFESYLQFQEANFGPLVLAKQRLPSVTYGKMIAEIREMTLAANASPNGALWIDNEYLQVIARKK